jgi:hypothetical protein
MIRLGAQEDWTKSTYSQGNGACVEVRSPEATAVKVTDSKIKDSASRPVLSVSPAAFTALVDHVRA